MTHPFYSCFVMMESAAAVNTPCSAQLTNERDGKLRFLALFSLSRASANGASLPTGKSHTDLQPMGGLQSSPWPLFLQHISSFNKDHLRPASDSQYA
jgi:hypothetical protein